MRLCVRMMGLDAAHFITMVVHVRGGGEVDRAERQEDERL